MPYIPEHLNYSIEELAINVNEPLIITNLLIRNYLIELEQKYQNTLSELGQTDVVNIDILKFKMSLIELLISSWLIELTSDEFLNLCKKFQSLDTDIIVEQTNILRDYTKNKGARVIKGYTTSVNKK